jgi:amino acid adenylation domain-containing protein
MHYEGKFQIGNRKEDKIMKRIPGMGGLAAAAVQHKKEETYWLEKLSGQLTKNIFPYDFESEKDNGGFIEKTVHFSFSQNELLELTRLSKGSDYSLNLLLAAGLVSLLGKYSSSRDIAIGIPVYKQDTAPESQLLNTALVLRNQLGQYMTFKELLLEIRQDMIEANENQNYPLEILVNRLESDTTGTHLPKNNGYFPLFDVSILLENIHDKNYLQHINHNLKFSFRRTNEGIDGKIVYNTLLYRETSIRQIITHYHHLLLQAILHPDRPVQAIDILTQKEKERLLVDFNKSRQVETAPEEKTIPQWFEEQVELTPDNIALVYDDSQITYNQLNKKANQLAAVLMKKAVKPGTIVGIMAERSSEAIQGILAILKAGGGYLPIDPHYPEDRIVYMLEDSRPLCLLSTTNAFRDKSFTRLKQLPFINVEPHLTPRRPPISDFDALPIPDRSLVNYERYSKRIGVAPVKTCITLQATRGCPYLCAYCHKIWPKQHVVRSAENIFDEVNRYYHIGFRRFAIIDDIFNLDIKNSTRFYELILKNRIKPQIFFPSGLRGDILTEDYIDLMVEAGVVGIPLALETASPRLQKLIKKHLNIDKLWKSLQYIAARHPQVILDLYSMHGFPTETEEEAKRTLEFIKSIKWLHFPFIHILKIFPNTDMADLAVANGVSIEAINRSARLAFHELPETLPFSKTFTKAFQTEFLNDYFLSKERLLHVLPHQIQVLTKEELVQKYDTYLPVDINGFDDLLEFLGITPAELNHTPCIEESNTVIPDLNRKIKQEFTARETLGDALRILLMDLSQYFTGDFHMLYDVVEVPLGLMYVMTYLKQHLGDNVEGKIIKARIDFDNYETLQQIIEDFQPQVIGLSALSFYSDFFHKTVSIIRQWGFNGSIIAGGPYATSDYKTLLQDFNIDLVVMGEGELTFLEVIREIQKNQGKLPGEKVLKNIKSLAFIPDSQKKIIQLSREILVLDTGKNERRHEMAGNPERMHHHPYHPAYIIYTSGTTGKPKGVIIEHKNAARLMSSGKSLFGFNNRDVWTQFHSYAFDFSVWEIYGALLHGAKLVGIPRAVARNPIRFLEILEQHAVTILNQTPSSFYNLIDQELKTLHKKLCARYVIFGGEALAPFRLTKWKEKYPTTKLVNMYGITETTVHVTCKEITRKEIRENKSNIGKPLSFAGIYVMDSHLNLVPPGVKGECYVGKAGVARGYLNRPELTAEKFRENPYKNSERLYRSGDMVRLTGKGELIYIGRNDAQVKIRGFRIEPAEVEIQLVKHPSVKEAVVTAMENSIANNGIQNNDYKKNTDRDHWYLCAYIVCRDEPELVELRDFLSDSLPEYMIPARFIKVMNIPVTSNGKRDIKKLKETGGDMIKREEYNPPQTPKQKKIAQIWEEVLGVRQVGITDNFFELGGDSLAAIKIISLIKEAGIEVSINTLFLHQTIDILAGSALEEHNPQPPPPEQSRSGKLENIPVKEEIDRLEPELRKIETPAAIPIPGEKKVVKRYPVSAQHQLILSQDKTFERISKRIIICEYNFDDYITLQQVKSSLIRLIHENSLLRSVIEEEKNGFFLKEAEAINHIEFPFIDVSDYSPGLRQEILAGIKSRLMQPMTVPGNLLYRWAVVKSEPVRYRIMFAFNHLIFDGESIKILQSKMRDIVAEIVNPNQEKKSKTRQQGENDYSDYLGLMASRDYRDIDLSGYTNLQDFTRCTREIKKQFQVGDMKYESFEIDISGLDSRWNHLYNEILLICYARFISEMFNIPYVPVLVLSSGRNYKGGNFNRVIGDFHDYIPLGIDLSPGTGISLSRQLENIIDYKKFAREHNINFTNFFTKKKFPGLVPKDLVTPFVVNSLIDLTRNVKELTGNETIKKYTRTAVEAPLFNMQFAREMNSENVWIQATHNSTFEINSCLDCFRKNYIDIIALLKYN